MYWNNSQNRDLFFFSATGRQAYFTYMCTKLFLKLALFFCLFYFNKQKGTHSLLFSHSHSASWLCHSPRLELPQRRGAELFTHVSGCMKCFVQTARRALFTLFTKTESDISTRWRLHKVLVTLYLFSVNSHYAEKPQRAQVKTGIPYNK